MSVFAKARARDLETGYAMDFIGCAMKPWIGEIVDKRIKVITDAGGVNLEACRPPWKW